MFSLGVVTYTKKSNFEAYFANAFGNAFANANLCI